MIPWSTRSRLHARLCQASTLGCHAYLPLFSRHLLYRPMLRWHSSACVCHDRCNIIANDYRCRHNCVSDVAHALSRSFRCSVSTRLPPLCSLVICLGDKLTYYAVCSGKEVAQRSAAQRSAAQRSTAQHSIIQHNSARHNSAQH